MKSVFAIVVAFAVAPAQAQVPADGPGPGRPGALMLLGQASVQKELKLTPEQIAKVEAGVEKQHHTFGELRNLERQERRQKMEEFTKTGDKLAAEVLDTVQMKRFKQIELQQRGPLAIEDDQIATALKLTAEQKEKAKAIQDETRKEMRAAFSGDREGARTKIDDIRKSANEKLTTLLTPEQATAWKELLGEPFEGDIKRPLRNRRSK